MWVSRAVSLNGIGKTIHRQGGSCNCTYSAEEVQKVKGIKVQRGYKHTKIIYYQSVYICICITSKENHYD